MSNSKQEAIEMCQEKLVASVFFDIDLLNRDLMIERLYYNQCWMMQALNIILEGMKR